MTASFSKTLRYLFLACTALSLVACGFHLRGQTPIPESLKQLVLTTDSTSHTFNTSLRIALKRAGITVVPANKASKDLYELKVNALKTSDTVLARNTSNDITQLERRLIATYFIRQSDGKSVYGPRTVSTSETLANQNAEKSVKAAYNDQKEEEMGEALANQLIYDLQYAPLK